mmetsp:Transcript_25152/g.41741  ORF Transcript_25152/g.41741 Transcript_25152/m.41741 type:complete len:194 (-) Transcript_25152:58-639(-)
MVLQDIVLQQSWLSLAVAQPKLKAVILHSVATVIRHYDQNDNDNADTIMMETGDAANTNNNAQQQLLTMKLFSTLASCNNSSNPTELLLSMARSPLIEVRLGAYAILLAVAKGNGGGAQVLLTTSGFYDFCITRDNKVETTKEGMEAKYNIVVAVLKSNARGLLADKIVKSLEQYVQQGPHYVKTLSWELATE